MSFKEPIGDCKNFYCRDQYWQIINDVYQKQMFKSVKGATLRKCDRDNCRGAHTQSEIHTLSSNYSFRVSDKSNIDLVEIYNSIHDSFNELKNKVKHPNFIERLNGYEELNFVELLNLWFDVTCFYRRLKKNILKGINDCDLYSSPDSVPEFYIKNENTTWSLERITKMCPKHSELIRKINRGDKAIIWDVCVGSVNCKSGCHSSEDMICHDDLLLGRCECLSNDQIEKSKHDLNIQMEKIKNILNSQNTKDGYKTKLKSSKVKMLKSKLDNLSTSYNKLRRCKHLTDDNIVPFQVQLNKYKLEVKDREEKTREQIQVQQDKKEERIDMLTNSKVKKVLRKPIF